MAAPNTSGTNVDLSSVGTTTVHSFTPAKSGIIATLTVDVKIPQEDWNIDPCDGTGVTGYNLNLSRIQMATSTTLGTVLVRFALDLRLLMVKFNMFTSLFTTTFSTNHTSALVTFQRATRLLPTIPNVYSVPVPLGHLGHHGRPL
jgi:hypothetical protein